MDRKKFVTLFSTSLIGAALVKIDPLNIFNSKKNSETTNSVNVRLNPDAVKRERSGKKNG